MCLSAPVLPRALELPRPANGSDRYTKPEAAAILYRIKIKSKKDTQMRANMMKKMVMMGLTPTSIRSLQRLVREKEEGKAVKDEPWSQHESLASHGCKAIQSKLLNVAAQNDSNLKYIIDHWWIDKHGQWRAKECTLDRY